MHVVHRLFEDKAATFIISGICLPILLNAVSMWLGNNPIVIVLDVVAILLLLVVLFGITDLVRRRRPAQVGSETAFQMKRRGIVFTLGLQSQRSDSVAYLVMGKLKPDLVGFLGTPATEEAGVVASISSTLKLQPDKVKSEAWDSARIQEGNVKAKLVIDWMLEQGLAESEIVVDLTGGPTPLSLAAFMAAEEKHIDCQYIQSEFDRVKNQRIAGSEHPILVTQYPA